MELTILTVPDCPHATLLRERLTIASTGLPVTAETWRQVATEQDAERWGMHGSPTVLVNGIDPFAAGNDPASVSCRLYRDEHGLLHDAPTVAQLRTALREASQT
ncbi:DsbA family protein [Streptacidiphilus carbonis]|uniref:DsbA family protein n=1 Tax=Streptacidiphilus carbonis TaxID=105422 RepID=UPI0005A92A1A|nr:DsbA family protein [Streptacidiphilus carbonis]